MQIIDERLEQLSEDYWVHLEQMKDLTLTLQTLLFLEDKDMQLSVMQCKVKWLLMQNVLKKNPALMQSYEFLVSMRYIPPD